MSLIDVKYRAYCRDGSIKCNNFKDVVKFEFEPERGTKITLELEDEFIFYRRIIKELYTNKTENIIYFFGTSNFLVRFDSLSGEIFIGKDKLRKSNGDFNSQTKR